MHIRDVIGEERYRLNLPFIEAALRGEEQVFERVIPDPDDAIAPAPFLRALHPRRGGW